MTTELSPFLNGNFAPVEKEQTAVDLRIEGSLPRELNGRLLRIGPNPVAPRNDKNWFTGNGMVHGISLSEGRVRWYRNRYVRDDEVCGAMGWPEVPGPKRGVGSGIVNTNIIGHAGRTFALVEGGSTPVELSEELETLARVDFDGGLEGGFTAHPKRDPRTGELHSATYYFEWDFVRYVVLDANARVRKTVDVPVPGRPMVHDIAITENYALIFDLPCTFNLDAALEGASFPYVWTPDYQARIGLLPREGGADDVRWFEIEPCYFYHALNAYEDANGRVILDVVQHERTFDSDRVGPTEGNPRLVRWVLDLTSGAATSTVLDDQQIEFPRHDERRLGSAYRYGYAAEFAYEHPELHFGAILKYDLEKGTREKFDLGPETQAMEPVFVPRSVAAAEDEGWLLSLLYNPAEDTSSLVVLAADDPKAGPLARVQLPQRVPFGFHGNWVPDPA